MLPQKVRWTEEMLKASTNRFKRRYNTDGTVIQLLEDKMNAFSPKKEKTLKTFVKHCQHWFGKN